MITHHLHPRIKGTNLLEVSISITVLTLGLLATISMLLNARQVKTFAQEYTTATLSAAGKMEEILTKDWEAIIAYNNIPLNSFFVKGLALPEGCTNHGQVQIETDYDSFIHTITVVVVWKNAYGNKSITMRTHCSK